MRLFIPFILVAVCFGLFSLYTNPTYQTIKELQIQNNSYDEALTKAKELHTVRDQLLSRRNAFATGDIDKLKHILPDNVDTIRLIIDINNIVSKHNLTMINVDLGNMSKLSTSQSGNEGGVKAVGSAVVGFSVSTGNYDDFLAFLQDVEHSLRLVDITKIAFTAGTTGITTYTMSIRTYWLH